MNRMMRSVTALCCECGSTRRTSTKGADYCERTVTRKCAGCGRLTRHAYVEDNAKVAATETPPDPQTELAHLGVFLAWADSMKHAAIWVTCGQVMILNRQCSRGELAEAILELMPSVRRHMSQP